METANFQKVHHRLVEGRLSIPLRTWSTVKQSIRCFLEAAPAFLVDREQRTYYNETEGGAAHVGLGNADLRSGNVTML